MSVVGISPTDIAKGVKILKDAATALKAGPEGARQQFADAHAALSSLEQAAADLTRSTSSGNPPDAIYSDLLERERRFQASLQPYARRLGPNTQAKPWVAIKTKLQYAFDGASKVQKHIVTSKPGVDAALLHTMRTQGELATQNHEQTVQTFRDGIASVTERVDAVGPDMIAKLSQVITSLPGEHSNALKFALRSHWESTKVDLSQLINQAVLAGISANPEVNTTTVQMNRYNEDQLQARQPQSAPYERSVRHAPPLSGRETSVVERRNSRRSTPPINEQTQHVAAQMSQHQTSSAATKLYLFLLSMSTVAIYQSPTTRKALAACFPPYHRDPVSWTLLLLTVLAFANCFVSVPLPISLLSDNSIFLDTALGEPLKVPRHYWESFDIFHGFLTTHFATRPGQVYVKARRYRILLGGVTGQVLDIAKWHMLVSPRMKLVMALLIEGSSNTCPKCFSPLAPRRDSLSYCANCDNFYQSLETSHGTIDGDDLEFFDGASLEPMESSSEVAFAGPGKQSLRDTGADALSSRLNLQIHPGELQHFVHMLLMESALSSSLSPSRIIAESTKRHSATEYLDSLTETLKLRMIKWHGLQPENFGSLRLYGHLTVGRPEQSNRQKLDCYLYEEIIIMVKNRNKRGTTVMVQEQEVLQYTLKGSVLFKKHLTHLSGPQGLVLTLNLGVAELPAINLYFNDTIELEIWRRMINDLAFGGAARRDDVGRATRTWKRLARSVLL